MCLVFPHPSGVSHFWNIEKDREHASEVLRTAIRDAVMLECSPYFANTPLRLSPYVEGYGTREVKEVEEDRRKEDGAKAKKRRRGMLNHHSSHGNSFTIQM